MLDRVDFLGFGEKNKKVVLNFSTTFWVLEEEVLFSKETKNTFLSKISFLLSKQTF
jgi:hypothetical protein